MGGSHRHGRPDQLEHHPHHLQGPPDPGGGCEGDLPGDLRGRGRRGVRPGLCLRLSDQGGLRQQEDYRRSQSHFASTPGGVGRGASGSRARHANGGGYRGDGQVRTGVESSVS